MDIPSTRFPTRQESGNVTQTTPSPSQIAEASIAFHQPVRKLYKRILLNYQKVTSIT